MLAHNVHDDAFRAAVGSGNLHAVKQHCESQEGRDTAARWSAAHRARRLGEPLPAEGYNSWGECLLSHGDVEIARWLLGREQLCLLGETLRAIARFGFRRYLVDTSTASIEILDIFFESPLFREVMDHNERLELLSDLLKAAAASGSSCWVGVLLAYGAEPNRESDFETPLEAVPYMGDSETLHVLLANGAWLESRNLLVQRTYDQAKFLVGEMVRRGADANRALARGGSVLHHAASYCFPEIVQSLIYDGFADVDARDHRGRTPLMVVGIEGYVSDKGTSEYEITSLLVDAGANVHAVCYEQRGVLQYAVGQRRMGCLPLLLEQGANPNHRDAKGQTPMVALLAKEGIRLDGDVKGVLTLLLEAGADPFLEDHTGNSVSRLLDRSEIGRAFMREKRAFFRRQSPTVKLETKGP